MKEKPKNKSNIDELYGYNEDDEQKNEPSFLELIAKSLKQKEERAFKPLKKTV